MVSARIPRRFSSRSPIYAALLCVSLSPSIPVSAQAPSPVHPEPYPTPATPSPGVQAIALDTTPVATDKPSRHQSVQVQVAGEDWSDTGIIAETGDQITFQASGSITLSDGHVIKPDGDSRTWTDLLRQYPLNSANRGALIGRVGNATGAVAFLVGAKSTLSSPVSGHLFLRANISPDLSGSGSYDVRIHLQGPKVLSAQARATSVTIASLLSPGIFNNIPRRIGDQQGDPGDMVNFALVGTEQQVKDAFAKAGWDTVDANTEDAIVHGLIETLSHEAYTQMPMSTLYLFGRPQDLAYARANPIEVAATRNHLRIWKTTETVDSLPLWVGAATHDHGFEKDQRNGGVTHHIDAQVDQERQFVFSTLNAAGQLQSAAYVTPTHPVGSARTATGGSFESDGRIIVMLLR